MAKSLSDTLGSWFVKYGIWGLIAVVVMGLIIAWIVARTTGQTPEKKSFKQTLRDAEEFLVDTVLGPDEKPKKKTGGKKESKGEAEARKVLREYFNRPDGFKNTRPEFLSNAVTGGTRNLEIDCFEPDLRLGVEFNGRQHYEFIPFFHKNKEAFYNQKYRDELKRRMCRDNGVFLIEIPYTVKPEDIKKYLISRLKAAGYSSGK